MSALTLTLTALLLGSGPLVIRGFTEIEAETNAEFGSVSEDPPLENSAMNEQPPKDCTLSAAPGSCAAGYIIPAAPGTCRIGSGAANSCKFVEGENATSELLSVEAENASVGDAHPHPLDGQNDTFMDLSAESEPASVAALEAVEKAPPLFMDEKAPEISGHGLIDSVISLHPEPDEAVGMKSPHAAYPKSTMSSHNGPQSPKHDKGPIMLALGIMAQVGIVVSVCNILISKVRAMAASGGLLSRTSGPNHSEWESRDQAIPRRTRRAA